MHRRPGKAGLETIGCVPIALAGRLGNNDLPQPRYYTPPQTPLATPASASEASRFRPKDVRLPSGLSPKPNPRDRRKKTDVPACSQSARLTASAESARCAKSADRMLGAIMGSEMDAGTTEVCQAGPIHARARGAFDVHAEFRFRTSRSDKPNENRYFLPGRGREIAPRPQKGPDRGEHREVLPDDLRPA